MLGDPQRGSRVGRMRNPWRLASLARQKPSYVANWRSAIRKEGAV